MTLSVSISQIQSSGVNSTLAVEFIKALNCKLSEINFTGNKINSIVVFPKILAPDHQNFKSANSFRKNEKSYFVGDDIDYVLWCSNKYLVQLDLIKNFLYSVILKIPDEILTKSNKEIFFITLEAVTKEGLHNP